VDELEKESSREDTVVGSCLVAKLAEVTKIKDGYHFHRRWFDQGVRSDAVATYKEWVREKGLQTTE
jgi:hypothetical protein